MKIYENANDQHVRKVVVYEVPAGLAFDKAGTELLTKEQIVDAFLKGCVVENEGNYKTPTGVNVTDSGAELVFGGGGSGGPEVENAIETGGLGWTESEPKEGFDITWDGDTTGLDVWNETVFKVSSDVSDIGTADNLVGATLVVAGVNTIALTEDMIFTTDGKLYSLSGGLASVAFEDVDTTLTKGIWFGKGSEELYVTRLYKEASTEEVVHQIDEKYIPSGGSGGGMVVHFNIQVSGEEVVVSADKTPAEVIAGALTGPVIGTLIAPDIDIHEEGPLGSVIFIDPGFPGFWFRGIDDLGVIKTFISGEEGSWVANVM